MKRLEFKLWRAPQGQQDPMVRSALQAREAKGERGANQVGQLVSACQEDQVKRESRAFLATWAAKARRATMGCMARWGWWALEGPMVRMALMESRVIRDHQVYQANLAFLALRETMVTLEPQA